MKDLKKISKLKKNTLKFKIIFFQKKHNHKYFLKEKVKKVIVIFYSFKNKYFDYSINKKKFNKIINANSINYFKINTKNKKSIEFEIKNNDKILNTFFIKKKEKKI